MTQVVIPMSGLGERFSQAGYSAPKPLVTVDGAAMISHVVNMFAADDRFIFVVNHDHMVNTNLSDVLRKAAPRCEIIGINTHRKGPVYAVSQCFDRIDVEEEIIVNYCDFYSHWNYSDFLATTRERQSAGAIAAYRNFHPHMLGTDNYAFIREENHWLQAIQEKKPFTDNRMAEFASNGTYYFARGEYVRHYFAELIKRDIQVNGEYYVSMVYNLMVEDRLPVSIYEVEHMLQWGTPRDLEEYQHWSDYFTRLATDAKMLLPTGKVRENQIKAEASVDVCLIPMAGRGQRFADAGYTTAKPLITVSGKPMVQLACDNLPPARRYVFVAQGDHVTAELSSTLTASFNNVNVVALEGISGGQAVSCQIGLEQAVPPVFAGESLLVGACDNGIVYDQNKWQNLLADQTIDVAAFSFRQHPASERNPHMFGWLTTAAGNDEFPLITGVSVKKAISDNPRQDHAIVGAFYFRKTTYFLDALRVLLEDDIRVNGEFYVDSMIGILAQGDLKCVAFEVDDYISFGIPNDLKTFEYWQTFFDKCSWHQYKNVVPS